MASAYGSWVGGDDWRAYVEITLKANSETETQATYIVKAWLQSGAGGYASNLPIKGWAGIWGAKENGTAGYTWSSEFNVGTFGANEWKYSSTTPFNRTTASQEFVVFKTHSQQTVYGYSDIIGESGALAYAGKESKAVATLTLAAKTSYQVTYNVNGGTGTIAAQTKWHGEDLTLTTDTPTRTNYRFLGWATSSTATTPTYQPGATFTADTATPLYAVWERTLIAPTISALSVYRVTSSAPSTYNDDGTNVYVSCTWAVDTTLVSGNKGQTLSIDYRTVGASSWTAAKNVSPLSAVSATTTTNVKSTASGNPNVTFAVGTSYDVRVTVTDTQGSSTSAISTISTSFVPFDAASSTQGHTMAFGRSASDSIPSGKQGEIAFGDSLWPVFDAPADWRSQLGANNASNLSQGTVPRARIENTDWAYLNSTTASSANWVRWKMVAGIVYVEVYYASGAGMTAKTAKTFGTIPEGYRPTKTSQNASFLGSSNNNLSEIWVETSGTIKGIAVTAASALYGNLCYPL